MTKFQMPQKNSILAPTIIIGLIILYVFIMLVIPTPKAVATPAEITVPQTFAGSLTWPSNVQAAIGLQGSGVLAVSGEQKSAPIASIAKTMLALAVLKEKPIQPGQQGPTITINAQDVTIYSNYLAQNGSVVPVRLGEQLTQYQAIQALLLPSGDNIADTLAIWAFGSVDNYLSYANQLAVSLGMNQTHFSDAGGLSPLTLSSAHDLVILGETALQEPILADVVSQKQVNLPFAGTVYNYNTLLGQDNVVGIKTGNTDEAGGCLLFATKAPGQSSILVGAILGASDRTTALANTRSFLESNTSVLQPVPLIQAGQIVGTYKTPWGKPVNVIAKNNLSILAIKGQNISAKVNLPALSTPLRKGQEAGNITIISGANTNNIPAVLDGQISKPSILWKLFRL